MTRVCTMCGQTKDVSEFYRRAANKRDGLAYECKVCTKEKATAWARQHPENIREINARRRIKAPLDNQHRCAVRRRKHKELGLCRDCSEPIMHSQTAFCRAHYIRKMVGSNLKCPAHELAQEMDQRWTEQGGVCKYSGRILTLGVNASIDHIMPRVRFPEIARSPENLAWADREVNRMKGEMTDKEFIELCRIIVAVADSKK